jgi:hypothetical protein
LVLKRIYHWLTASNSKGHGMHSPFVYDFIVNVLNDDRMFYAFNEVENKRNGLIKANVALDEQLLIPPKNGQLLFKIINYYQFQNIVSIGDNRSIASLYIAAANHNLNIVQVAAGKGFEEIHQLATIDFIFINSFIIEPNYLNQLFEFANNNSFIIINNIYTDKNAATLWNDAQKHALTKSTIDLFSIGIVLFNNNFKVKQHFKVRF